jgi:hypothetical protein
MQNYDGKKSQQDQATTVGSELSARFANGPTYERRMMLFCPVAELRQTYPGQDESKSRIGPQ